MGELVFLKYSEISYFIQQKKCKEDLACAQLCAKLEVNMCIISMGTALTVCVLTGEMADVHTYSGNDFIVLIANHL